MASNENDKVSKTLEKIFELFYAELIKDRHSSTFFKSLDVIKKQINIQTKVLKELINYLKSVDYKIVNGMLTHIAYRHYQLGVDYSILMGSFTIYHKFLVIYREDLKIDINIINRLKNMLRRYYIKNLLFRND